MMALQKVVQITVLRAATKMICLRLKVSCSRKAAVCRSCMIPNWEPYSRSLMQNVHMIMGSVQRSVWELESTFKIIIMRYSRQSTSCTITTSLSSNSEKPFSLVVKGPHISEFMSHGPSNFFHEPAGERFSWNCISKQALDMSNLLRDCLFQDITVQASLRETCGILV